MSTQSSKANALSSSLFFWLAYVAIALATGFITSKALSREVWQLTAWGFLTSGGLLALVKFLRSKQGGRTETHKQELRSLGLKHLSLGLLIGIASFALHLVIVSSAHPIRFELVPETGALVVTTFFLRFLATSCMEEIGFRGYALQKLKASFGTWPAVVITAIAFGLSHLLYGWELSTIALGVIPCGILWGMSALASGGIAMPIGLHAAWNFASWFAGARAETGLFRMIVEDGADEQTRHIGMISYLTIFGLLIVAFWLVHRIRTNQNGSLVLQ